MKTTPFNPLTYTPSTELERQAELAEANKRRLRDYYRKRAALNALRGVPTFIPAKHRHVAQYTGR